MEAIFQVLYPYRDLVGALAGYVTIAQCFSGIFICKNIYKRRSTKGTSATPFIGGIVLGVLFLKYGLLTSDLVTIKVNAVIIVLNFLYALFYYWHSEDKVAEIFWPLAYGVILLSIILGYAEIEKTENLGYRFGLIVTIFMLALIGSPLVGLKEIIAKKNASSIPVPMTFMGTIVSLLWLLYGLILQDNFMIIQNVTAGALCITQLVLILLYPNKINTAPSGSLRVKKKTAKRD